VIAILFYIKLLTAESLHDISSVFILIIQ